MPDEMDSKKVLILFPFLQGGGAQMVCAWILNALQDHASLTLGTFDQELPDAEELNRFYGTSLRNDSFQHVRIPLPRLGAGSIIVRQHALSAFAYSQRCLFDYFISAYGHMRLPSPSLCYVHFPQFRSTPSKIRAAGGLPDSVVRKIFRRMIALASYGKNRLPLPSLYVCNSEWTSKHIEQAWGVKADVVYPPVPTPEPVNPAPIKQDRNVCCISRLHPEKEIELLLDIGEILYARNAGFVFHLICGGKEDRDYHKILTPRFEKASAWLRIYQNIPRPELNHIAASSMFGIHCKQGEHFGIAVAEMLKLGVIPIVRSNGGAAEIVSNHPDCIYETAVEAATRLEDLASDPIRRARIKAVLESQNSRFMTSTFCHEIRTRVLGQDQVS